MSLPRPKYIFGLVAICLVLATPIVMTTLARLHESDRAIATIVRERDGLRCGLVAGDLLRTIQERRANRPIVPRSDAGDAIEAALRRLHSPVCAAFVAGPRTSLERLASLARAMQGPANPVDRTRASVAFADAVLALFLDVGDACGLTYDPSVDAVNLDDAIMARIPALAERMDESAEILDLVRSTDSVGRPQIVAAEKLAGQAHEIEAMASDDFDGALFALPSLNEALSPARAAAHHATEQLGAEIDREVGAKRPQARHRALTVLRRASITAGRRLLQASAHVLERSFDARIAADRATELLVIGGATLALLGTGVVVALTWNALRRRDRIELERAHQRTEILETQLARRDAERALWTTQQQFRTVFDGSHVGIATLGRRGQRLDANAALQSMFGTQLDLITARTSVLFDDAVGADRNPPSIEECYIRENGDVLWVELSLSLVRDGADGAASAILLAHDITEHKTINARLGHQTLHDALTALPNRVHFIRRLGSMIEGGEDFAVVFIDLDRFKVVNDTLGHHAGDEVLRLAARRLLDAVRSDDFVARLHGDEFALIVSAAHADNSAIDALIGRLQHALRLSVETPAEPILVSASIGYVRDGASHSDPEELLRAADAAMYASKLGGRDRTTSYDPTMLAARSIES